MPKKPYFAAVVSVPVQHRDCNQAPAHQIGQFPWEKSAWWLAYNQPLHQLLARLNLSLWTSKQESSKIVR
jgi:hypothetical protein